MIHASKHFKLWFLLIVVAAATLLSFLVFFVKGSLYFTPRYMVMTVDYLWHEFVQGVRGVNPSRLAQLFSGGISASEVDFDFAESVPVLVYHGINRDSQGVNVSPDAFYEHLSSLYKAGYRTITLQEFFEFLRGERQVREKSFLLTFDDGRRESYYETDPFLRVYGYTAVMALSTGETLSNPTQFYLNEQEIKEMVRTGRWEFMSYGHHTHETAPKVLDGDVVPVFSNRIYREDLRLRETESQYVARIASDLDASKRTLERVVGVPISAFAVPTGKFGEQNKDFSEAEGLVRSLAERQFPLVFSELFPRNPGIFRSNIISHAQQSSLKRILIDSHFGPNDVLHMLETTRELPLPYSDTFSNRFRFVSVVGDVEVQTSSLRLHAHESSALMYLDGSYALTDSEISLELDEPVRDGSVSLIARYVDTNSYLACEFGPRSVVLKQGGGERSQRLEAVSLSLEQSIQTQVKLSMRMLGDEVQCFLNEKPVLQGRASNFLAAGGVGVKYWNMNDKEGSILIRRISVRNPREMAGFVSDSFTPVPDGGAGIIYSHFDKGSLQVADAMLSGVFSIDRYKPVTILHPTWREDPYKESYWRFNFYNLDSTRHLLYAFRKTGNRAYYDRLVFLISSFIKSGMDSPYAWDLHGAAFRAMVLTNTYDKLARGGALTPEFKSLLLSALERHGNFLLEESNYEGDYNHGLDQSAALYLVARNFPQFVRAQHFESVALDRLSESISGIIDEDGVLVENSPYYHFYVLEKYWEIAKYLHTTKSPLVRLYESTIKKMIEYGALVLQPNLHVPVLGASLDRSFQLAQMYEEMARISPRLKYVLTRGLAGAAPEKLSYYLPHAGQTIMRSHYGSSNRFTHAAQVIFDVGTYRTDHSDLDALSFHLYGHGGPLIPDAGLYTYESGPYRDYFHGTRGHNTVVVDDKDQSEGRLALSGGSQVTAQELVTGNGFVAQSAEHRLYPGVQHRRAVTLIRDSVLLIFDELSSLEEHSYEQRFHLTPRSSVSGEGAVVNAQGPLTEQKIRVEQLAYNSGTVFKTHYNERGKERVDGLCSLKYEEAEPCHVLSYTQKAKNASFVTAIFFGPTASQARATYDEGNGRVHVSLPYGEQYEVTVKDVSRIPRVVETHKQFDAQRIYAEHQAFPSHFDKASWSQSAVVSNALSNSTSHLMRVTPPSDGKVFSVRRPILLDLSHANPMFKMRVVNRQAFQRLRVEFSNNNWQKFAMYDLRADLYPSYYEGDWVRVGIGKGELRNPHLGNWNFYNGSFDWSLVDGMRLVFQVATGTEAYAEFSDFQIFPDANKARAVVIFDDGWSTVMGAADVMKRYNIKGNVGVISSAVGKRNYLTLDELKHLQNDHGWAMVNHSSLHKNALEVYDGVRAYDLYEADILDGLEFLERNGINSAPNWYIYPHGKTNGRLKEVVGKYYQFARATQDIPEVFPYADSLAVKVLSVYFGQATVLDVKNAIADAKKHNLQLFLMFHKFAEEEAPNVFTEYSIDDFEAIIKEIKTQGIDVLTLPELDKELGLLPTTFTIKPEIPAQLTLSVRKL